LSGNIIYKLLPFLVFNLKLINYLLINKGSKKWELKYIVVMILGELDQCGLLRRWALNMSHR
jgi:hypothetical protein